MASKRGSEHRDGERGAGAFAEPHVEVEDRPQAKLGAEPVMPGFGRAMRNLRMIESAWVEPRERCCSRGGDEAVEQHGDAVTARGERGAEDGGKLAAAENHARGERVGVMGPMTLEASVDRLALAGEPRIVKAGAAPGPALAAAAEQRSGKRRGRGGVADAHLAEAEKIGASPAPHRSRPPRPR